MAEKRHLVEEAIRKLSQVLQNHDGIVEVCMVDFITKDLFEKSGLDPAVVDALLLLPDEELVRLPERLWNNSAPPALDSLAKTFGACNLDALGVLTPWKTLESELNPPKKNDPIIRNVGGQSLIPHLDRFMPDKKMHEVLSMSEAVATLAAAFDVGTLVDLGSGKAYLSQLLACHDLLSLKVLAIDSSEVNSGSALKRTRRLEKKWDGLLRRAACRANGQEPPKRGKNWKAKDQAAPVSDNTAWKLREPPEKDAQDTTGPDGPPGTSCGGSRTEADNIKFITQFVEPGTDVASLAMQHFPEECPGRGAMGLFGLHTCGNLAPNSLGIFLSSPAVRFCCNVGCCYHLLDELFDDDDDRDPGPQQVASFPMSSFLKARKSRLGRNARMLAAQPMDRIIQAAKMPSESLLWRAVLQVILVERVPDIKMADQQVGRIAGKSPDFISYVRSAMTKLGLTFEISDEDISTTFKELAHQYRAKLNAFYLVRTLFGPVVEGLILLDRLLFLLEQEDEVPGLASTASIDAHLVRLFDPVVSPRCYAIVATKRRAGDPQEASS